MKTINKRVVSVICAVFFGSGLCAVAKEYYELRVYHLKSAEKAAAFDRAVKEVFLPMAKNAGAGPVGVFRPKEAAGDGGEKRYVLITYPELSDFERMREGREEALEGVDVTPALEYLMVEGKDDAAFERIESTLLVAFDGFPKLADPEGEADGRFFELRVYESPSELKGDLKVEMFNGGGELAIFDDVGLRGVFYGQALVADNLPQLSYLLVYDSEEEKKRAWDGFRASPAWDALKREAKYANTVSKIHSVDLVALPYSPVR